jgi:hypothetical protein
MRVGIYIKVRKGGGFENFEDIKWATRSRKSKDRHVQHNGHKEKERKKRTSTNLQKTKD